MQLPLLERAAPHDGLFCLTPLGRSNAAPSQLETPRIPSRLPGPGEQFRFHFDMARCIGCHCCEVACNEQNGNPATVRWRRVGEIEGGSYPFTQRFYLSMGCNHCLQPSCLEGCPVEAYTKDGLTGIVQHNPDVCIGCQYCTWNCPYGVPQYNPERGVVGKCDLCYHRLLDGREPACVAACPLGAIRVEIINIEEWKRTYHQSANGPGLPPAETTISTTRISVPQAAVTELKRAGYDRVRPEHPHWPLVCMLVLTQLSVGALTALWIGQLAHAVSGLSLQLAAALAFMIANLALAGALLHLGRPVYAWRALKMWRRSWLSREVLLFSLFAGAASLYAAALWIHLPAAPLLGALTATLGAAGLIASACIYLVPARPAWNSGYTVADYLLTAAFLGPLLAGALTHCFPLLCAAMAAAGLQLLNQVSRFLWLARSDEFELHASARLLSHDLERLFIARLLLLVLGGLVLPLTGHLWLSIIVALGGELLSRYLFFVAVVPKNIAATFFAAQEAA